VTLLDLLRPVAGEIVVALDDTRRHSPAPPARRALRRVAPISPGDFAQIRVALGASHRPIARERRTIDLTVTNLGTETWPSGAGRTARDPARLPVRGAGIGPADGLLHQVAPGEAPDASGTYTFVIDVVRERHRWFGRESRSEPRSGSIPAVAR
jgi:hypothetical protein